MKQSTYCKSDQLSSLLEGWADWMWTFETGKVVVLNTAGV